MQQFLELFRAGSEEEQMIAAAVGAKLGHGRSIAAVVAFHAAAALVVGQGDGAVGALHGLAAAAAQGDRRVSPAIEQDHRLLFAIQPLAHLFGQLP